MRHYETACVRFPEVDQRIDLFVLYNGPVHKLSILFSSISLTSSSLQKHAALEPSPAPHPPYHTSRCAFSLLHSVNLVIGVKPDLRLQLPLIDFLLRHLLVHRSFEEKEGW